MFGFFPLNAVISNTQKNLKTRNYLGQNLVYSRVWSEFKNKFKETANTQMQGCTPELKIALIQKQYQWRAATLS